MKRIPFACVSALLVCGCGQHERGSVAVVPTASPAPTETPSDVSKEAPAAAPTSHRLLGAFPSERALGDAVLLALKEKDATTLESFRVTEREYLDLIFPEFPQAQGENRIPPSFHWSHLDLRSRKGVIDAIDNYGGEDLEFLEFVPTQGIEEFRTYKVLKKVELKVRRRSDGVMSQIRVFGSVILMDGEYKILSFPT